jgi:hypothetical protein
MNSGMDEYLNQVDRWKQKVHEELQGLTPKQRAAFWARAAHKARRLGLRVAGARKPAQPRSARTRSAG